MNKIQNKTFNLLEEIKKICEANNITYYLAPGTSHLACTFEGHSQDSINLGVMVPAGEIKKLINLIEKEKYEDRKLDYMGNYKNFISFQVHYVDSSTTFVNFGRGTDVSCYGARVSIIPIRTIDRKSKLSGILETGWECNGYRFTREITFKRLISIGFVRMAMIIGKRNLANILFNYFCKNASGKGTKYSIKLTTKKEVLLDEKYFSQDNEVKFQGDYFKCLAHIEDFLEYYYGASWKEECLNAVKKDNNVVISSEVPYEEYLKEAEAEGVSLYKVFSDKRKNLLSEKFVLPYIKRHRQALLIAKRSGARLKYYEELQQQREEILSLYENNDFEQLEIIFDELEKETLFYLRRNLGLCVSKEYFEIICELLKYHKKEYLVQKLEALIPPEHMTPII